MDGRVWSKLLEPQRVSGQAPPLSLSVDGEDLFLYLAISQTVVNSTLICEESKVQRPVYYTSQAFQGAEVKYPWIENKAFSLIVASRKLYPYFQAHTIIVMTDQPIKKLWANQM